MVSATDLDAILAVAEKRGVLKLAVADLEGRFRLDVEFKPPPQPLSPPAKEDPAPPRTALDMLDVQLNEGADRVEYPKMGAEVEAPRPAGTVGWATDNPAKEK